MTGTADPALAFGDALQALGLWLSPLLLVPLLALLLPGLAERPIRAAGGVIDRFSDALLMLTGWCAAAMALFQIGNVVLRYVFNESYGWAEESVTYAFGVLIFLGAAGALKADAHVRVDILQSRFSPRRKAFVDLLGTYLFLFPVMIVILVYFAPTLAVSWRVREGSYLSDGIPFRYLLNSLVMVFAATMIVQGWAHAGRMALRLRGREDGEGPAEAVRL